MEGRLRYLFQSNQNTCARITLYTQVNRFRGKSAKYLILGCGRIVLGTYPRWDVIMYQKVLTPPPHTSQFDDE